MNSARSELTLMFKHYNQDEPSVLGHFVVPLLLNVLTVLGANRALQLMHALRMMSNRPFLVLQ